MAQQPQPPSAPGGVDAFLAQHTSEDNAAFQELQQQALAAHREKHWWLYERHDIGARALVLAGGDAPAVQLLLAQGRGGGAAPPSGTQRQNDGLGEGEGVNNWKYRPRNQLMFTPDLAVSAHAAGVSTAPALAHRPGRSRGGVGGGASAPHLARLLRDAGKGQGGGSEGVEEEGEAPVVPAWVAPSAPGPAARVLVPHTRTKPDGGVVRPRALAHAATRLPSRGGHAPAPAPAAAAARPSMQAVLAGQAGEGGYTYVATPSPMPGSGVGVHATPAITWGAVAATPMLSEAAAAAGTPGAAADTLRSLDPALLAALLDTAEGGGGGIPPAPSPFRVQPLPERDALAHSMARRQASGGPGGHDAPPSTRATSTLSAAALSAARSALGLREPGTPAFPSTATGEAKGGQQDRRGRKRAQRTPGGGGRVPPSPAAAALAARLGVSLTPAPRPTSHRAKRPRKRAEDKDTAKASSPPPAVVPDGAGQGITGGLL